MKLVDITTIQESSKDQVSINFPQTTKKLARAMGWEKGDRVAIYRHGAGFFIEKAGKRHDEEQAAEAKECPKS